MPHPPEGGVSPNPAELAYHHYGSPTKSTATGQVVGEVFENNNGRDGRQLFDDTTTRRSSSSWDILKSMWANKSSLLPRQRP